jgi:predicted site-specific integrase-resolvase
MKPMYLTAKEVAERLRVSPGTLSNWRVQGAGPDFMKMGSKVLYPLTKVESWERACLRSNTAQK